jgi:hypothetical protein
MIKDAVLKVVKNQIHKKNIKIVKNLMIKLKLKLHIFKIKKGFLKKKIGGLNLFIIIKIIIQSNVCHKIFNKYNQFHKFVI